MTGGDGGDVLSGTIHCRGSRSFLETELGALPLGGLKWEEMLRGGRGTQLADVRFAFASTPRGFSTFRFSAGIAGGSMKAASAKA